jgi:hypothetical protein
MIKRGDEQAEFGFPIDPTIENQADQRLVEQSSTLSGFALISASRHP